MGEQRIWGRSICVASIILGVLLILAAFPFAATYVAHGNLLGAVTCLLGLLVIGTNFCSWGARGLSRLGHISGTKKTKIADDEVRVYQDTDSRSAIVARLAQGTDVEIGKIKTVQGLPWVAVTLPNKQQGYVVGHGHFFTVLRAKVIEREAIVWKDLTSTNLPLAKLSAGSEIEIHETDWDNLTDLPRARVNVWLPDGQHGYIDRGTKVKWV